MLKKLWRWQNIAADEAGHAVVASAFPSALRVISVSIDAEHHGNWIGITRLQPVFRRYGAFATYAMLVNAVAGLAGETIDAPLSLMEMLIPSSSADHDRNHVIDRIRKLRGFPSTWRGYVQIAKRLPLPYHLLARPLGWNLGMTDEMALVILLAFTHAQRILARRHRTFRLLEKELRQHGIMTGDRLDEILGQSPSGDNGD